jgi:hypothetical protein
MRQTHWTEIHTRLHEEPNIFHYWVDKECSRYARCSMKLALGALTVNVANFDIPNNETRVF